MIDIAICVATLFLVPFLSTKIGAYAFIIVPIVMIARILLQKLAYDKHSDLAAKTMRRTALNIDPISFELLFVSISAAIIIALWKMSSILSVIVLIIVISFRILLEYLWFSDRPNRWFSLRFRFYRMRRKMFPSYSERLQNVLMSNVDDMKQRDFEKYVAEVLTMTGFKNVKKVKSSKNRGINITARFEKEKYAIQCVRSDSSIGVKTVQEANEGKELHKADVTVIVTNNYFTKQAYEAGEGKVALWDRERLSRLVSRASDSITDEKYNEEMKATGSEIRMFAALFDRGKGDARLTEKVMGTIYPEGSVRSEEDVDHFLIRVGEYLHKTDGISERRLKKIQNALEKGKTITPFEAEIACYHLSKTHTITMRDMNEVRNKLAKAFLRQNDAQNEGHSI